MFDWELAADGEWGCAVKDHGNSPPSIMGRHRGLPNSAARRRALLVFLTRRHTWSVDGTKAMIEGYESTTVTSGPPKNSGSLALNVGEVCGVAGG